MDRRHFLSLLALGGTGAALNGSVSRTSPTQNCSDLRSMKIRRGLARLERSEFYDMEEIGESYLQDHPEEADRKYLANAIFGGRDQIGAQKGAGISFQVRQNYASDYVIRVKGWVLSITEARLCALGCLF